MKSVKRLLPEIGQRVLGLSKPFKIALASLFTLILLFLIYPFQLTTVPAWSLQVVDSVHRPLVGIHVTEHWQHYLLEPSGNEDFKISDDKGRVQFPERTIRASILSRFLARVGKMNAKGQSARTDPYGSIVAWGSKDYETTALVINFPNPPPTVLVVRAR